MTKKKIFELEGSNSNLLRMAIPLAAICIAAITSPSLPQEIATPRSGRNFMGLLNTSCGGGGCVGQILAETLVSKFPEADRGRDIWVAVRTDGKRGDGSQWNPSDGSTQAKFDRLMESFGPSTVIHLGPGIFQTNIVTRKWRPLSGWKVKGAGTDVTTIQAVGNLAAGGHYFVAFGLDGGSSFAALSDNVTVSDLTVDCNWEGIGPSAPVAKGQRNCKVGIITLMGSNNVVERVHGKNQYGSSANGAECFGIRLAGFSDSPTVSGNIIRYCVVDSPQGDYSTPFFLGGGGGIASHCEVHNCQGCGRNDGNGYSSTPKTAMLSGGVNIADLADSKIHDNVFVDCVTIVHHDTGPAINIEVYNNEGIRCSSDGISSNNSIGWRIYKNLIQIQNRNGTQGNYALTFGKAADLQIIGNKLTWVSGGNGTGTLWGVSIPNGTGVFADNLIDSHLNNNRVPSSFCVPAGRNKTETGKPVKGLKETGECGSVQPQGSRSDQKIE